MMDLGGVKLVMPYWGYFLGRKRICSILTAIIHFDNLTVHFVNVKSLLGFRVLERHLLHDLNAQAQAHLTVHTLKGTSIQSVNCGVHS